MRIRPYIFLYLTPIFFILGCLNVIMPYDKQEAELTIHNITKPEDAISAVSNVAISLGYKIDKIRAKQIDLSGDNTSTRMVVCVGCPPIGVKANMEFNEKLRNLTREQAINEIDDQENSIRIWAVTDVLKVGNAYSIVERFKEKLAAELRAKGLLK